MFKLILMQFDYNKNQNEIEVSGKKKFQREGRIYEISFCT
jgi:hypothetical protein